MWPTLRKKMLWLRVRAEALVQDAQVCIPTTQSREGGTGPCDGGAPADPIVKCVSPSVANRTSQPSRTATAVHGGLQLVLTLLLQTHECPRHPCCLPRAALAQLPPAY